MADGSAEGLRFVMDQLSPDGWLIRANGANVYLVQTPGPIDPEGRRRIRSLFWPSTVLDFREGLADV